MNASLDNGIRFQMDIYGSATAQKCQLLSIPSFSPPPPLPTKVHPIVGMATTSLQRCSLNVQAAVHVTTAWCVRDGCIYLQRAGTQ